MIELNKLSIEVLQEKNSIDDAIAEQFLVKAVEDFQYKIVVLDDDPTGVQTVHDVAVYTEWTEEAIRNGFLSEEGMFFILTNSRSFSQEKTIAVHKEIANNISKIAKELNKKFLIISRGDSTLRGHYPIETEILSKELNKESGLVMDGEIICPFFPEGGRYTIRNIHYVKEGEFLSPAGTTEFAKDKTFGYSSSDLTEYVEEKTKGEYKKEDCIIISSEEIRAMDMDGIKAKLMDSQSMRKIIVNAADYTDLKIFGCVFIEAVKAGKNFIARTAAAFPKVVGHISDRELLTKEELVKNETNGGIVLVGSHVKKTTNQLNELRKLDGDLIFIEFNVNTYFEGNKLEEEVNKTVEQAEKCMEEGKTVVIYTSRQVLSLENMDKEEILKISVKISDAVTSIIGKLNVKPRFIIAKGGITSSDVGTKALRVKKASVMGQIKKGIPVWMTGQESKFPGMPYIIFPGNVGENTTLREIVEELL